MRRTVAINILIMTLLGIVILLAGILLVSELTKQTISASQNIQNLTNITIEWKKFP